MAPDGTKKSKWGLSNLIHKDGRSSSQTNGPDSTYGGSEDSIRPESYTGSDASREGEKVVTYTNNQGQTVTTTVTTTTTTTTTSGPNGTSSTTAKTEPQGYSGNDQFAEGAPNIPQRSNMRERSPNPPIQQQQSYQSSEPAYRRTPPPRQALQTTASQSSHDPGYNGGTPSVANAPPSPGGRHNFSYPARATPGDNPTEGRMGTLEGLKTAAVGLHGGGETLRGTLSSAVDKRFNAPPETIAAHESVANSGRSEIHTGQLSENSRTSGGIGTPSAVKGILRRRDGRDGGSSAGGNSNGASGLRVVNE